MQWIEELQVGDKAGYITKGGVYRLGTVHHIDQAQVIVDGIVFNKDDGKSACLPLYHVLQLVEG